MAADMINKKIKAVVILLSIILIGIIFIEFSSMDTITIDIYADGENITVNTYSGFLLKKEDNEIKEEIINFLYHDINNVDSNVSTIKKYINNISTNNGYINVNINLNSPFGQNTLPMMIVVDGRSMYPTLDHGEKIIINKTKTIKINDIVVVKNYEHGLIVKRVSKIKNNQIFLTSDNKFEIINENGITYETYGFETWENISNIIGVVNQ
jgi:hypothetical protein